MNYRTNITGALCSIELIVPKRKFHYQSFLKTLNNQTGDIEMAKGTASTLMVVQEIKDDIILQGLGQGR